MAGWHPGSGGTKSNEAARTLHCPAADQMAGASCILARASGASSDASSRTTSSMPAPPGSDRGAGWQTSRGQSKRDDWDARDLGSGVPRRGSGIRVMRSSPEKAASARERCSGPVQAGSWI